MFLQYILNNVLMLGAPIFNAENVLFVGSFPNYTKPYYLTIQSAINDAIIGNTIIVAPQVYDETVSIPDGINLYFMPGAEINSTSTSTPALSVAGQGEIFGHLRVQSSQITGDVVVFDGTNCNAIIDYIQANVGANAVSLINNSFVNMTINEISQGQIVVNNSELFLSSKKISGIKAEVNADIIADIIEITGVSNLDYGKSILSIETATKIDTTSFFITGGVHEIKNMVNLEYGSANNMIAINAVNNVEFRLKNSRLKVASGLGYLIWINDPTGKTIDIVIDNSVLINHDSNSGKCVGSGLPRGIIIYDSYSNTPFNSGVSATVGTLTVNENVK